MTEPHETFIWYDTKPIEIWAKDLINNNSKTITIKELNQYATKRNRRIAIKRAVYIGLVFIAWGAVIWMM